MIAHNAAGPIGVGLAIKEAGKVGEIIHVGLDDLDQLIVLIKEGVVESSYSTKPKCKVRMQFFVCGYRTKELLRQC